MKKALSLLLITLSILFLTSCSQNSFRFEYGVFIGAETEDVDAMKDYRIIVVEGQLFDKDEVNGGGTFVSECIERGVADELFDAVNQESVLSCILWDEDAFGVQDEGESRYFREYLKDVKKHGFDVYLLEYTKDEDLAYEIRGFCEENGYGYYISDSLELGA